MCVLVLALFSSAGDHPSHNKPELMALCDYERQAVHEEHSYADIHVPVAFTHDPGDINIVRYCWFGAAPDRFSTNGVKIWSKD